MSTEPLHPPTPARTAARSISIALLPILAAVIGAALLLIATNRGIGLKDDAVDYVATARSVLAGRGFMTLGAHADWAPLTVFPPLYPLLLSVGGRLTGDPVSAAPYVAALFYAGTLAMAAVIAQIAFESFLAAAATTLLLMCSLLSMETMALSESAFTFLALGGLWLLAIYLRRNHRLWLIGSGGVVAAAMLTRYAGLSLVFAALVCLAWLGPAQPVIGRRKRAGRLLDMLLFGLITLGPTALWVYRNSTMAASAVGRHPMFHPIALDVLKQALAVVGQVLVPIKVPFQSLLGILVVGGVVAGAIVYLSSRRRRQWFFARLIQRPGGYAVLVLLVFAVMYPPFLLFSIAFVDPLTTMNYRILCPMIVPVVVAMVVVGRLMLEQSRRPFLRPAVVTALLALVLVHAVRTAGLAWRAHHQGIGYQQPEWRNSPTLAAVKAMSKDTFICTNGQDVLYLLADRMSCPLPQIYSRKRETAWAQRRIKKGIQTMAQDLVRTNGVVVCFDRLSDERSFVANTQTLHDCGVFLAEIFSSPDGHIYKVIPPVSQPIAPNRNPSP